MADRPTALEHLRLCSCREFIDNDPAVKPPSDRDIHRHYVKHGPVQPAEGFVRNVDGRCFRAEWYTRFPWLEYSVSKQAAYCFYCRLFALPNASTVIGGQVDSAFVTAGFDNWKKALEKGRGFQKHCTSQSHGHAEKSYRDFIEGKAVDTQLSEEKDREVSRRQELIHRNRQTVQRIFSVVRFIARLTLPFRGHDETPQSLNRGVFLELIRYLAENGDKILADHLSESAANATYLAPQSQNEMISIVGEEIQQEIVRRTTAATVFSVMMDETTDVSHKEQVAVFVRYINESTSDERGMQIEERLLALVDTAETTGEALASLLIETLQKHQLSIGNVVGQGYDGGSNMRGASKGVQARIKELNPMALFTHCFAHNLNRALVNAACDTMTADVRNFFGIVELVFTFIEGSAARHAFFLGIQRDLSPDEPALHLKGLSDTRWNCRASSLRRLSTERVFRAAVATIEHVSSTTTDGSVRGTAAGLMSSICNFKFLLSMTLLTPVLESINNVSEALQSAQIDILKAHQHVSALTRELKRLRDDQAVKTAMDKAAALAEKLNIESELPTTRQRKAPRRLDENPTSGTSLSPVDNMKVNFYYAVIDRLSEELRQRFPEDLLEFSSLHPRHFAALDSEQQVRRLAIRYQLQPDVVSSQWRLSHHFVSTAADGDADLLQVYQQIPATYTQLRHLYKVLLTLPVTTASVERGFSKMAIVKSKLRSTMAQERLEALLLSTVERDLLLRLNDADLVAIFAAKAERKLLLA